MARAETAQPRVEPLAKPFGGFALLRALWRLLGSTRFALVLIGLLALAGLLGTVFPQVPAAMRGNRAAIAVWLDFQEGKFGVFTQPMYRLGLFDVFNSRWFVVLLTLLAISVGVYTTGRLRSIWQDISRPQERMPDAFFERARHRLSFEAPRAGWSALAAVFRRRRYRVQSFTEGRVAYLFADRFAWAQLGTLVSHLALILFLVGGLLSRVRGFEVNRLIAEGTAAPVFDSLSRADQMQVFVQDAIARFDDRGNPLDYRTEMAIYQGGREVAHGVTTVNDPFKYGGYSFHQAAYFGDGAALRIRDPATGRSLYQEVLSLGESTAAPEVAVRDGGGRVLLTDVVVPTDFIEGASGTLVRLPGRDAPLWLGLRPDSERKGWELLAFEAGDEGIRLVARQGEPARAGGLDFELRGVVNLPSLRVRDLPGFPGEALLLMSPDSQGVPYLTAVGGPTGQALVLYPDRPFVVGGLEYEFLGRRDFAGISVRRDPGANFIWVATGLLLAGLAITFYVPRRRVWAKITNGRVWFAGMAGPMADFESEMRKVVAEAGSTDSLGTSHRREEK